MTDCRNCRTVTTYATMTFNTRVGTRTYSFMAELCSAVQYYEGRILESLRIKEFVATDQ